MDGGRERERGCRSRFTDSLVNPRLSAPTIRKRHPQCFRRVTPMRCLRCLRYPYPKRRGVVGDVSSSVLVGRARPTSVFATTSRTKGIHDAGRGALVRAARSHSLGPSSRSCLSTLGSTGAEGEGCCSVETLRTCAPSTRPFRIDGYSGIS